MATNSNVLAVASTAVGTPTFNTFEVRSAAALDVPAIGNYGPKYQITFTRKDTTTFNVTYTTSSARNTALAAYKTAFGTTF